MQYLLKLNLQCLPLYEYLIFNQESFLFLVKIHKVICFIFYRYNQISMYLFSLFLLKHGFTKSHDSQTQVHFIMTCWNQNVSQFNHILVCNAEVGWKYLSLYSAYHLFSCVLIATVALMGMLLQNIDLLGYSQKAT